MFTRTITSHILVGIGKMRWQNALSSGPNSPETEKANTLFIQARDALEHYDRLSQGKDSKILARQLRHIHEIIDQLDTYNKNIASNFEIDMMTRIDSENDPQVKDALLKIQKVRQEGLQTIQARRQQEAARVTTATASATAASVPAGAPPVSTSGALSPKASDDTPNIVVGQREQATALIGALGETAKGLTGLEDTNIPSLLSVVTKNTPDSLNEYLQSYAKGTDIYEGIRKLGYSSNGTLGASELSSVKSFIEYYNQAGDDIKRTIKSLASYTDAGLPVTLATKSRESAQKLSNVDDVITYLSDVSDARFRASDVRKVLESLKSEKDFIKNLANVAGLQNVSGPNEFTQALKTDPTIKARFFENINTAGANQVTGLRSLLSGNGLKEATEKAKKINEILQEKVQNATQLLDDNKANANPTEKEKIEAVLAEYKAKGSPWMTGEIRKVAEGAFANIGNNMGAAGAGMTFEAFIQGLTVSLGAGISNGKASPGIVVHYDVASGKLTETQKKIIEGNIGVGASVFPKFVPMIDGSVKATDKIEVYGNGIGGVDAVGLNAMITKGGGILALSFTNERKSEIDQGLDKLNSIVGDLSKLKSSEINLAGLKTVLNKEKIGAEVTDTELNNFVTRMTELYRVNGVTDQTPSEVKAILIKGLIESEAEKKYVQEAMNDKDARSYKGWSVGVGHLFGITFPLVGIMFKEGKVQYVYPETKNDITITKSSPIDVKSLFDKPKFNTDNTYYLPLSKKSELKGKSTILPDGASLDIDTSGNTIGIQGLKGFGIKVTKSPDATYKIEYDNGSPIAPQGNNENNSNDKVNNKDITLTNLERNSLVVAELGKKEVRIQLSRFWLNSVRNSHANKFATSLQEYNLADAKSEFIKMVSNLGILKPLRELISNTTDTTTLESALFDIRGAMMMDVRQAEKFKVGSIDEKNQDTLTRVNGMLNDKKMSGLLTSMGLTVADFDNIVKSSNNGPITISEIKPGVYGAIASLKTGTADMARMPAGTVRYAKRGDQEFTKDITGKETEIKEKIFKTIIKKDSHVDKSIRKAIDNVLKLPNNTTTYENLSDLLTKGTAKIQNKDVTMKGQKFGLCMYGDCTNPGVTIELGKLSIDGNNDNQNIQNVSITAEAQENQRAYNPAGGSVETSEVVSGMGLSGASEKPKPKPAATAPAPKPPSTDSGNTTPTPAPTPVQDKNTGGDFGGTPTRGPGIQPPNPVGSPGGSPGGIVSSPHASTRTGVQGTLSQNGTNPVYVNQQSVPLSQVINSLIPDPVAAVISNSAQPPASTSGARK